MPNVLTLHNVETATATAATVTSSASPAATAIVAQPANLIVSTPVSQPLVVRTSATQATINQNFSFWHNPVLNWLIGKPQPRSSFSLPTLICPVANPTDQTLFEEPQDATKKHYLPQYGIATHGSGASLMRWVSFAPTAQGFVLTVHLSDVTDPSFSANRTAITAGSTRYFLSANLQGRTVSWDFQTANVENGTLVLTLTVKDLGARNSIYHAMTDASAQAQLMLRRSLDLAVFVPPDSNTPANPPMYRQAPTPVDSSIPFTFDVNLDKNVFAQLTGISGGQASLNIQQVSWKGRPYPYYQDPNQPAQVYYLPDSFKISRQPTMPHAPNIIVSTNGDDPNSLTFTISFLAVPVWDPNRLTAAAAALQNVFLLDSPPTFSLLEATNTVLALTLPPSDPSSAPGLQPQPGANIDIAAGVKCSVTFSLPQFQQVYAALFDRISQLLSGVVTVTVESDVRKIPFISSAADFAGDIFDLTSNFDPTKNQFVVALQNSIESSIHVDSLPAALMKGNQQVPNTVQQIAPALPIDVVPVGASAASTSSSTSTPAPVNGLTVTLQLPQGQAVDQSSSVLFDYSHCHVVPSADAIWEAIMSNQVVGPVKRAVKMMVFSSIFNPPATSSATSGTSGSPSGSATTGSSGTGTGTGSTGSSGSSASGTGTGGTSTGTSGASASGTGDGGASGSSSDGGSGGASSDSSSGNGGNGGTGSSGSTGTSTASSVQPPTPPPTVMAVQVVFENGQTASFDPSTPATSGIITQSVSLSVPVKMYVLQQGDASFYKYRIVLITSAGTKTGDWITSNQDSFYVQVNS